MTQTFESDVKTNSFYSILTLYNKQIFLLAAGDKVLILYVSALWWSIVTLISLTQEDSVPAKKEKKEESESEDDDDDDEPEPGSTLFVKNINFDTQEADLKEKFKKCGDIKSVSISKKKDVKNPGMSLLTLVYQLFCRQILL